MSMKIVQPKLRNLEMLKIDPDKVKHKVIWLKN